MYRRFNKIFIIFLLIIGCFTYCSSSVNVIKDVFLRLDQTVQQYIIGGAPIFEGIQLNTSPTTSNAAEGLIRWNSTDGTIDLGMFGGDITMQVGQELFMLVRNVSGSTILNGTPVYISGRTGNRPNIYPSRSDIESTAICTGITTQDIESSSDGFITTMGYVRQIKTNYSGTGAWGNTWQAGDELYISKTIAGQLTNVEPATPHHSCIIGHVGVVGDIGIGSILVNIKDTSSLRELTDINGTDLTETGQILVWDNTNEYFDFNDNINNYLRLDQSTPQTIQGDIFSTGQPRPASTWHAFGGFQDQNYTLNLSGWTWITNVAHNLFTGVEGNDLTLSGDIITVVNAGDYTGSISLTFSGLNGKDFCIRVYNITQNIAMGYKQCASTTSITNFVNLNMPIYLECNAGDQLRLEMMETTDSPSILLDCMFYISYIHE